MNIQEQEQTRDAWNRVASGYAKLVGGNYFKLGETVLRKAGIRSGMKFLDVAAGSGALSIPAARLGAKVLATDIAPRMLDQLQAQSAKEGLSIEISAMDGQALDLPSESFDMAGSQFGVMLFPDMPRGLKELTRVVKPGGRVLMVALGPIPKVDFFSFFLRGIQSALPGFSGPPETPLPFQLQDPEKLLQEMTKAGLKDVRVEQTNTTLEFQNGTQFWDWLLSSNPLAEMLLTELGLTGEKTRLIQKTLEQLIRERAGKAETAILNVAVNIGIGTK